MTDKPYSGQGKASRFFSFMAAVVRDFQRNQGFLLSGAVAYYTLLSVVPMSILVLTVLSHVIGEERLVATMSTYLEMVVPGYTATLLEQVRVFVENRQVIGIIGFIVMLFFSSIAFTVLENAISVIFFHHVRHERRGFLVSALIPFVYICALALGIVLVSVVVGAVETLESRHLVLFNRSVSLAGTERIALYVLGIAGELLMLTSIYLVMPVVRVTFRHALIGGVAATLLWEITRRILVWYYASLSMVNIIYGSIATVVVTLLSIEVSALILLLGAQVIAELETTRLTAADKLDRFET
ncbi:YihY/virulence factor BrkB family protein [Oryzomonas japonica]|uniref:YihY/virulence factor BrkB family protein n=1 Tax=Oryzomonas japonica TaxID=2603858 RepID=A0A7J4ZT91_9BACT|nr:YihY/virulence factor BrkB family protein [Oryzomonas japonica]KAB0666680.1 YihY/virulence factor BrkB family protein [Oryzomonas japonica]